DTREVSHGRAGGVARRAGGQAWRTRGLAGADGRDGGGHAEGARGPELRTVRQRGRHGRPRLRAVYGLGRCGSALAHVRQAVRRPIRGPGRPHTVHRIRDPECGVAGDTGWLWRDIHGPVWWFRTLGWPGVSRWEGPRLAVHCLI